MASYKSLNVCPSVPWPKFRHDKNSIARNYVVSILPVGAIAFWLCIQISLCCGRRLLLPPNVNTRGVKKSCLYLLTFRWSNSLLPQKSKHRIQSQKTIAPTGSEYDNLHHDCVNCFNSPVAKGSFCSQPLMCLNTGQKRLKPNKNCPNFST